MGMTFDKETELYSELLKMEARMGEASKKFEGIVDLSRLEKNISSFNGAVDKLHKLNLKVFVGAFVGGFLICILALSFFFYKMFDMRMEAKIAKYGANAQVLHHLNENGIVLSSGVTEIDGNKNVLILGANQSFKVVPKTANRQVYFYNSAD